MNEEQNGAAFTTKLTGRTEAAERTMMFRFEKPPGWAFKPGQFIEVSLIRSPETDAEGDTRAFSIASAPGEPEIMVATRMRDSAFKRVLGRLPLGTLVQMEGPFGDLMLHNNVSRAAVFLTGGIGVTPVRSILVRAARERLPHRLYLFYSNRRPEDALFLEEMYALERENPNFRFVPTMTEMAHSHREWRGETGYVSRELLHKHLEGAQSAVYYITGPPGLVSAMRTMLNQSAVDDDDIRTEEFTGY
jgi:ferredoxin-NADP reductase